MACRLKEEGGLGVIDLAIQNTCLLLLAVDKLLQGDDNPWANWIRYWYTPGRATCSTPCWRAFARLLPTYRGITTVTLSNGASTTFWHDNWTSLRPLAAALPALFSHCLAPDILVASAISDGALRLPLRGRLSPTAQEELDALATCLRGLRLGGEPDSRRLAWGARLRCALGRSTRC